MEPAETWNVVILLVQVVILIGQLLLSRQINKQTTSKEKGYFIIDKTNATVTEENRRRCFYMGNQKIQYNAFKMESGKIKIQ